MSLRSAVLLPLERLVSRARAVTAREEALARVRARFRAQPSRWRATPEQRRLAARLVELKAELAAAFAGARSCGGCARGEPGPKGRYDGGRCCGTATDVVFTSAEVHALSVAGVRARDLVPAGGDLAGCAFRGERGCSLAAAQRPAVCGVYACGELKAELRGSGAADRIHALRAELHSTFEAFLRASGALAAAPVPASLVER